jgi:hypothetical protein
MCGVHIHFPGQSADPKPSFLQDSLYSSSANAAHIRSIRTTMRPGYRQTRHSETALERAVNETSQIPADLSNTRAGAETLGAVQGSKVTPRETPQDTGGHRPPAQESMNQELPEAIPETLASAEPGGGRVHNRCNYLVDHSQWLGACKRCEIFGTSSVVG